MCQRKIYIRLFYLSYYRYTLSIVCSIVSKYVYTHEYIYIHVSKQIYVE